MSGLYFLLPTLLVILVSLLVVRAAAIALMMTGMDKVKARFQALSAFSGTGFTTKEAELVTNNPLRRKIITWLMILGNAGIITIIVAGTSSLVTSKGYKLPVNIVVLAVGIYLIYKVATHKRIMKSWESFIEDRLIKSTAFEEGATEDLLHFFEGYGLVKGNIMPDSTLVGSTISKSKLSNKGLQILGIERGTTWIPTPKANETIQSGDKLVVYGILSSLRGLFHQSS
jgi:hypothetical protein